MEEFLREQSLRGIHDEQVRLFTIGEQYHDSTGQIWESIKGRCAENKLPVTLVLSSDRVIVSAYVGAISDQSGLLGSVDTLLGADGSPPEPVTQALPVEVTQPAQRTRAQQQAIPPVVLPVTSEKSWLRRGPGWIAVAGAVVGIGGVIGLGAANLYYRQENQTLANNPSPDAGWFDSMMRSDRTVNILTGTFWATAALTGFLASSSIVIVWDDRRHARPIQKLTSETPALASEVVP
jgi:hypothetical protein